MFSHDERVTLFAVSGLILSQRTLEELYALGGRIRQDIEDRPHEYTEPVKSALREVAQLAKLALERRLRWDDIEFGFLLASTTATMDEVMRGSEPPRRGPISGGFYESKRYPGVLCVSRPDSRSSASSERESDSGTGTASSVAAPRS